MMSMCHQKCVGPYDVHVSSKMCGSLWSPCVTWNAWVSMMSMCHLNGVGPCGVYVSPKISGSLWCPCVTRKCVGPYDVHVSPAISPQQVQTDWKKLIKMDSKQLKKGTKLIRKASESEVLALVGEPLGLLGRLLGGGGDPPFFTQKSDFVHPPKNELFFKSKLWENITWTLLLMLSFEVCFRCSFFNDFKWFWTSKWMCFWRGRHAWNVINNRWIWVFVFFTQDRFFIPQKTHPGSFCEVILAPNLHQVGTRSRF